MCDFDYRQAALPYNALRNSIKW